MGVVLVAFPVLAGLASAEEGQVVGARARGPVAAAAIIHLGR
jgi:hypothetical protein